LLSMLARLVTSGLVWLAPPCQNFIWVSRSGHGRSSSCPRGFNLDPVVNYWNGIADFVAKAGRTDQK
jgi:hypothetical protein